MTYQLPRHLRAGHVPRCRIYLNGEEQHDVVEADLDEGWLVKYVRNSQGDYMLDTTGEELIQSAKVHGVVVAELF